MDIVNWGDYGHRYFNKLLPNIVFAENYNTLTKKINLPGNKISNSGQSHPSWRYI